MKKVTVISGIILLAGLAGCGQRQAGNDNRSGKRIHRRITQRQETGAIPTIGCSSGRGHPLGNTTSECVSVKFIYIYELFQ